MARRLTAHALDDVDDQFALLRSTQFLRIELVMAAVATITAVVLFLTTPDAPASGLVVIGAFASTVIAMLWGLRRLAVGNVVGTVLVYAAVMWASTVVLAPLIPFALPAMTFPMVVPLLVAGPLLERRQLLALAAVGAVAMAAVAALALGAGTSPIDDVLDDTTEDLLVISVFAMRAVTIALAAWDANARRDATLVAAAEARDAIQASRARLVEVGDEQRRALERDLHDGAQQRLVALAMRMRLLADRHPELVEEVDTLGADLQEALADLREVAHGIYPPLLERAGLGEALRAASRRTTIPVSVHADVGRYPRSVESAVYYACVEALQNAAKHAETATSVTIDLRERRDGLAVEVSDDGPGFDRSTVGVGRGLENMADRVAAIGAQLVIDSEPGRGTTIRAVVPIDPAEE